LLLEMGRLARHVRCTLDLRDGIVIIKRQQRPITGSLTLAEAMNWLRLEVRRLDEVAAGQPGE
jgi:hypothetical protein